MIGGVTDKSRTRRCSALVTSTAHNLEKALRGIVIHVYYQKLAIRDFIISNNSHSHTNSSKSDSVQTSCFPTPFKRSLFLSFTGPNQTPEARAPIANTHASFHEEHYMPVGDAGGRDDYSLQGCLGESTRTNKRDTQYAATAVLMMVNKPFMNVASRLCP
ncbi:hypothetical protein BT96DRAFT_1047078 [Gymnopus androsaceus JB14]|uniref:Uncharacterized protein n=1 Tax=Gymnopus androsaceus JB14 TaxID=1447944 RepID=A0A6A4GBK4_9AGAR|nr:hypothetical protein BT96DRAFT_1047078 [Gymnopus androsaceus JB14]